MARKASMKATLDVRIIGRDLPGSQFCDRAAVHVGIQRRKEVVFLVPGDAASAVFDLSVEVVETAPDGHAVGGGRAAGSGDAVGVDFRGPFVHGRKGERFLYLSWGELGSDGSFTMFRRAKLHLSVLDPGEVAKAARAGRRLEGTLHLTNAKGEPLAASIRPPRITWRFVSAHASARTRTPG
jgi:hypothetical protein